MPKCTHPDTDRRRASLFQAIAEEEIEKETTERNTQEKILTNYERNEEAARINSTQPRYLTNVISSAGAIQNNYANNNQSINETSISETSGILKPIIKNVKNRQLSHQTVDIKAFREKLKKRGTNKSFREEVRFDIEGHQIIPGGTYRIMFADEVENDKRHSLATTHIVESYKRYNAPT